MKLPVIILTCLMATAISLLSGCSVFMAAKQPPKKDLTVLNVGTPRNVIIAELGSPVHTETKDGLRMDIYNFVQGYSKGAKAGRAVFHGAADVLTLGLWEVVGTPTEGTFDGNRMSVEVRYDASDRVREVVTIKK
ncbi:MAG: hypothetical protein B9S33_18255 [Pedosphaera sp. Tous-C6FEB]|nr:MAG: hypothetical protein B9S33_18255 [Pedosphaera sp. Tous-C6FEB]